jgi:hypothetical protein
MLRYAIKPHAIFSWHTAKEAAGILVLDERQANTDVTASGAWARQMLRHFIQLYVPMCDLEQKLQRTLLPDVRAPDATYFN